jgi:mRNA interferase MazF
MEESYIKYFDRWNEQKKVRESSKEVSLVFHEREIWWCSIGVNIGDGEDGKNELFERPVPILKKFNRKIALVLPMSKRVKENKSDISPHGPLAC